MFKRNLWGVALKAASIAVVCSMIAASPADAFYRAGRVWTSTTTAKSPTVFSGSLSSSLIATASASNLKWGGLQNSSLNTGSVFVTSSLNTYDNASFKIFMQDNYVAFGDASPGITLTCSGCDFASISLNTQWVWSNQFLDTPKSTAHLGYVDSATVVLHELGHAYGLDHPDNDPNTSLTAAEVASVMFVTFTIKRNLTSDDIAGIASMY
jgi:hypothetical protein